MIMSEAVLIVLISGLGCTFLTVIGAIITQYMSLKKSTFERQEIKNTTGKIEVVAEKTREENKEGFDELKLLIESQNIIIDLILRDRLLYLLKSYQGKEAAAQADKDNIVAMYTIYEAKGLNGTVKTLFEKFDKLTVI